MTRAQHLEMAIYYTREAIRAYLEYRGVSWAENEDKARWHLSFVCQAPNT